MARNTAARQSQQQSPEKPPIGWMLRRSVWILPAVFGFGYISFVSYFWLAKKWQNRGMNAIGLVLLVFSILYLPTTFLDSDVAEADLMHIFFWLGPVLQGLYLNPRYLRTVWRREMGQQQARQVSVVRADGAASKQRSAAMSTRQAQPARPAPTAAQKPRRSSSPQPRFRSWDDIDTQRTFGTVGLVDLATATVDELEVLPFISRARAEQLVMLRDRGRLRDISDVIAALKLQPHEAAAIRARLAFGSQGIGANQSGAKRSKTAQSGGKSSRRGRNNKTPQTPAEQQQGTAVKKPPRQGRILDV